MPAQVSSEALLSLNLPADDEDRSVRPMRPEFKLIAAGLVVLLFLMLPVLLYRAGRALRLYVLPFLPLICAALLAFFEPALLYPSALLLLTIGAYACYTYLVAGSIELEVRFSPTPLNNTVYLALSSLAACVLGGIGATLVFLGPLVRMNQSRRHDGHIPIFFLIIVTNLGGLVSPVGSAHLYVLYSLGIPAERFLELLPFWIASMGVLLLLFLVYDAAVLSNEPIQTDPRAELHDLLYRALQTQQVPQSLLLRTIDYLESPKAMLQGGFAVILVPLGLSAIMLSARFGNALFWREATLIGLGVAAALIAPRRRVPEGQRPRPALELLVTSLLFFACVAFVFLPLWSRSLAAAGAGRGLVVDLPLSALLQALAGWLDGTTAVLATLVTRLPAEGPGLAAPGGVPPAWTALLAKPHTFWLLAVVPSLLGGLTYASDQANLAGRRVSEANGILMPGFFAHFLRALPIVLVAAAPSAAVYWLLAKAI